MEKSAAYKRCVGIIVMLKKHPLAPQFINLQGFMEVIGEQMDLGTMEHKLTAGNYSTSGQFVSDGRKTWFNVIEISPPGTDLYNSAKEMSNYFENLITNLGDVSLFESHGITKSESKENTNKGGMAANKSKGIVSKPLSAHEKAILKHNIMRLTQDQLQGVIEILQNSIDMSKNSETLEFDIDKLPVKVARELDKYVKENIPDLKKVSKKKPEQIKKKVSALSLQGAVKQPKENLEEEDDDEDEGN